MVKRRNDRVSGEQSSKRATTEGRASPHNKVGGTTIRNAQDARQESNKSEATENEESPNNYLQGPEAAKSSTNREPQGPTELEQQAEAVRLPPGSLGVPQGQERRTYGSGLSSRSPENKETSPAALEYRKDKSVPEDEEKQVRPPVWLKVVRERKNDSTPEMCSFDVELRNSSQSEGPSVGTPVPGICLVETGAADSGDKRCAGDKKPCSAPKPSEE